MTEFPLVSREAPVALVTPVIPLNFVYPGLSLAQIISIVKAYRKLSLLIILVVMSVTALIMAVWPRTYTAMLTLMVNYEVNDPLNGKQLPVGQVGTYIATQVELMQTPEVLLTVVDRLKLTQNKDYARGYSGDSGTLREWVAKELSKNLAIYQSQLGSQLIYVTYSANNPPEAAQVANTVAEVYKEQDYLRSTGPPGERAKRYAQQLNELKSKVDQAQKEVTAFHQRNSLIEEGSKTNVDVILLATLEGRLLEAQNARRAAEARASEDQSVNDQVLASTLVQSLKTQLATQESRLAQLTTVYTRQHPDVRELQSQIAASRRSLASVLQSYSANASAGLSVAQRLEQNLQRAVVEQRAKVLAKGQLHDEAAKYLLELESAQAVYKRALEGYDQIMFASGGHDTNVSFVSRATPPVKPSKPKVLTGLILGCMAAAFLALGIPLGYELFTRRVRCRDDLERHHGIPVLVEFGALPMRSTA
ncbi:MAG TPA: Wzz/FepE/Etk N-terminal domain-containing protein [Bradyrhizobium sp.]|jgi:protein tyrosine kinase modulator|nr:Wzz/FepE/Etk N-terminal domain-containing protein [Xanthobacteraceae bacterium]HTE92513.1 Wzz/FepE/Etk N-terminal domain-containing protein [Bradyrhizobium sp.]